MGEEKVVTCSLTPPSPVPPRPPQEAPRKESQSASSNKYRVRKEARSF